MLFKTSKIHVHLQVDILLIQLWKIAELRMNKI